MRKSRLFGIFGIFSIVIIIPVLILARILNDGSQYKSVRISDTVIKAEVANTPLKRTVGLMSKSTLPSNQGMLFIFNDENHHSIWMMNTSIPLDIIWIDSNHKIIDIVKNAQPCFLICEIYTPDEKALYVLEVNSGFVKEHNVQVGEKISIS